MLEKSLYGWERRPPNQDVQSPGDNDPIYINLGT